MLNGLHSGIPLRRYRAFVVMPECLNPPTGHHKLRNDHLKEAL